MQQPSAVNFEQPWGAYMRVLVTGASGFMGRHAVAALNAQGWSVRAVVRRPAILPAGVEVVSVADLAKDDPVPLVAGMDAVLHLAGRAHIMKNEGAGADKAFYQTNVEATHHLATAAVQQGVRRFVLMSSIGAALVEARLAKGMGLAEIQRCLPYQASKYIAERTLWETLGADIELVAIRPPLVYGPDAPGNLAILLAALNRRIPLPLASIANRRSFLYIGNLVSAILACLTHPAAAGQIFAVADGEDLATPELVRRLAMAAGLQPPLLLPFPPALLVACARLVGFGEQAKRLTDSIQIDINPICSRLNWRPPYSVESGFASLGLKKTGIPLTTG
jgi:nucleoside-diphosphate-sugar epimerase